MSKNLEIEYKSNIEAELPDLWARIEKELPEREITNDNNVVSFVTRTEQNKKKKTPWAVYSAVGVAAVVFVIAIPAIIFAGRNLSFKNSENSIPMAVDSMDAAADDTYYYYEDEAADDCYEEICEESYTPEESYDITNGEDYIKGESQAMSDSASMEKDDESLLEEACEEAEDAGPKNILVNASYYIKVSCLVSNIFESDGRYFGELYICTEPTHLLDELVFENVDITEIYNTLTKKYGMDEAEIILSDQILTDIRVDEEGNILLTNFQGK